MPNKRSGEYFPCVICGEQFYRRRSYVARGIRKTCGKTECKSASMSGANNPFWGKTHSEEMKAQMVASHRARPGPRKRTGPPKGYKHTPEARAQITAALKKRWANNRDKMLDAMRREPKPREKQRYRHCFTRSQKRDWQEPVCRWCGATDSLVLDHIIPVLCGGSNEKRNAQTLCTPCNIWKMTHVDRALFVAGLVNYRGQR